MVDEIKTRISVDGEQAERNLRAVSQAEKDLGRSTKEAGDEAEKAGQKKGLLSSVMGGLRSQVTGLVGGLVGVGGLLAALRAIRAELEENTRATREYAEASLNLQFLSQTFNPQEREFVGRASVISGRQPVETVRAFADLKSRFPNLSDQDLQSLFLEAAETARTTDAPLSSIVTALSTISLFEKDPQRAQNILRQSIIEAGVSDPSKLSPLYAKYLGVGTGVGGLSTGEAAGAVAAATGLGLPSEESVTALRTVTLSLAGKGTPEGVKILEREGIGGGNIFSLLQQLSGAVSSGKISNAELESIAGREGVSLLSLLADPVRLQSFLKSARRVGAAQDSATDLTRQAVEQQLSADEVGALNFAIKQSESQIANLQNQDTAALERDLVGNLLDKIQRRNGVNPVARGFHNAQYALFSLFFDPEGAARLAGGAPFVGPGSDEISNALRDARNGVTINNTTINTQYNGTAPPQHRDSGRRGEGLR